MTLPPRLPPPLERVVIPSFFSPSRFGALLRCKLSVLGESNAAALLPPVPLAILGTIVHHVRRELSEGRWDEKLEREAAVDLLLHEATQQVDAQLLRDVRTRAFAPLRQAIGRREWDIRASRLQRWASRMTLHGMGRPSLRLGGLLERPADGGADEPGRVETGDEAWLVAPSLRLRGRSDRIEETTPGTLDIVDFKSGKLQDDDGQLLPDATLQVRLYAIVVEEIGSKAVRLFLEGDERHRVPWNDTARRETRVLLETVTAALPRAQSLPAQGLAEPGRQCRECRLRPSCPRYSEWAPTAWTRPQPPGDEPPLDVWGSVESVTDGPNGHRVELRDASGRLAIVDGLSESRGMAAVTPSETVHFFDLQRTEDRKAHGRVTHPLNFHEHPPDGGRRLTRARGLQVFRG
ncbi:PD-(D/E)XK nuclease family protein [Polyangium sp. y55x31]|uniref:PD-(D/E)XK nuclease family protein n=1 Tax=Polyangium sp. y55x31 TaxID=3042688 RepID=UPI002482F50B|nr:PD-(D/E)XK nuclease family protein [Polyangium sp. y55x31]MDI1480406.1 PD-(D/E)XK nuclease family protein [Polyangium sp. y55x31]